MLAARAERRGTLRAGWSGLAGAISFLTIVPVGTGGDVRRAAGWFPLVGAAVGALAGGVRAGLQPLLGAMPATVLAVVALVIVTGALHQDGLADTIDGLGVRGDRARRLAVMRDSAVGVFGALALIGWTLLLVVVLDALTPTHALEALTAAAALGRGAALVHAAWSPPARAEGLGARFAVGGVSLTVASVTAVTGAIALCGLGPGLAAVAATLAVAGLSVLHVRATLGGRTGDTLGATVALAEVIVCTVLLAVWRG
ncbi:MAG TPA: adenosylcobinamide-GDP ribazoletransferase [Solirubrobacteraceae bacterium]|nr:adenosylcobinamide-GDP ribazoletransferase [Solirubrobacteraceae bacterium]